MESHELEREALEVHGFESQQRIGGSGCATDASGSSADEDETQLAAIRELMQRAFARGVWLTLGEIAEVTEFAEASISAQLRHLRKPHHGGHRVEKRRRRPQRLAAAKGEIRDVRRGPVIWEYRVLPKRSCGLPRAKSEAPPIVGGLCGARQGESRFSAEASGAQTTLLGRLFGRRKQEFPPETPRNDSKSNHGEKG